MGIQPSSPCIVTVTEPVEAEAVSYADAHCHLWIEPNAPDTPVLNDESVARAELADFAATSAGAPHVCPPGVQGRSLVVDCQPGFAGRDGRVLARLARASGVAVVGSTGFHLRRYYREGAGPWWMSGRQAHAMFVRELEQGMEEVGPSQPVIFAGCVKAAWTGGGGHEHVLMEAAAAAAVEMRRAMTVHTEHGEGVDALVHLLHDCGVDPRRVQISHMDKRPDHRLHFDLANAGFILGYDTFLRPKYDPDNGVWPLLRFMIASNLWRNVAIGLDLVDASLWRASGGSGLRSLPCAIAARLRSEGSDGIVIHALTGGNVARVLAGGPEDNLLPDSVANRTSLDTAKSNLANGSGS